MHYIHADHFPDWQSTGLTRSNLNVYDSLIRKRWREGFHHAYTLWIAKGQYLTVTATSENQVVYVDIVNLEDGVQLISDAAFYWFGVVPSSQEYQIKLWTRNPGTIFFLSIEVPANIEFDNGINTVQIDGYIEVHSYFILL